MWNGLGSSGSDAIRLTFSEGTGATTMNNTANGGSVASFASYGSAAVNAAGALQIPDSSSRVIESSVSTHQRNWLRDSFTIRFKTKVDSYASGNLHFIGKITSLTDSSANFDNKEVVLYYNSSDSTMKFNYGRRGVDVFTRSFTLPGFVISIGGFETPSVSSFEYTPAGSGWTFTGLGGITKPGSFGSPAAVDGSQVAFLQNISSISASVTTNAELHKLSFYHAARPYPYGGSQIINVKLDGTIIDTFTANTSSFTYREISFTPSAGTHTLAFEGTNSSGDQTGFIDKVSLIAVSNNLFSGNWIDIELTRDESSVLRLFVNGIACPETYTDAVHLGHDLKPWCIGGTEYSTGTYSFQMDDVVVINGRALHTSNFTP